MGFFSTRSGPSSAPDRCGRKGDVPRVVQGLIVDTAAGAHCSMRDERGIGGELEAVGLSGDYGFVIEHHP